MQCGALITESGLNITTEDGSTFLTTECFVESALLPGRVYKGEYPYWKRRRKPFWEDAEDQEEEIAVLMSEID